MGHAVGPHLKQGETAIVHGAGNLNASAPRASIFEMAISILSKSVTNWDATGWSQALDGEVDEPQFSMTGF